MPSIGAQRLSSTVYADKFIEPKASGHRENYLLLHSTVFTNFIQNTMCSFVWACRADASASASLEIYVASFREKSFVDDSDGIGF